MQGAVAAVYANIPEGMLFMSNMNENHKHTIVQATVVPFALIAAGAAAGWSASTEARARAEARAQGAAQRQTRKNL